MKLFNYISILLLSITLQSCFCWADCTDDQFEIEWSNYDPILMDRETFENSVSISEPKTILNSGKIYVQDTFLFINEINEGFHIYENSDPTNPTPFKFLKVPGATDLAIRNEILYINQATDLIAVSVNTTDYSINLEKRIVNTFPEITPPDGSFNKETPEEKVVVGWIEKK